MFFHGNFLYLVYFCMVLLFHVSLTDWEKKMETDGDWGRRRGEWEEGSSSVCGPTLNIQRDGKKEDAFASRTATVGSRKKHK